MTEKELFCSVISAALFPETHGMPEISREQYSVLHAMLKSHTLNLLPAQLLNAEEMPESLRSQWERELYEQKRRFGQHLFWQDGVLGLFAKAGIPCVILKGAVSASYYPEPAYRAMGDIDLLVRPGDREKSADLLRANGFQEYGYRDEIEQSFVKGSCLLELHVGICQSGRYSDRINALLIDHMEPAQRKELYGFGFPCLAEPWNGLVMLEHMHHHMRDRLGFRQVVDWMLYVDNHLDDAVWDSQMRSLLAQCALEPFAIVVTAMCQRYFGLRTEGISWTRGADAALCEELFDHINGMGNFGNKLKVNENSVAWILRDNSLLCVLMDLQKLGVENWAFCRRHPWLRPFAWLYQIFLYLYRIITEKYNMSLVLVVKERKRVRKALELMKKLGLQQKDNNI